MSNARIAVLGAGGIGAYFGAKLAQAGNDVAFIARGAHLDAMRKDGLRVDAVDGPITIKPCAASHRPDDVGPVDFVLHATKMTALADDPAFVEPLVGKDTRVVSLQNGVDAPDMLAEVIGAEKVLGGLAFISAHIAEPGRIEQIGPMASIEFGPIASAKDTAAERLKTVFDAAGITADLTGDIRLRLWRKFCILAPGAGLLTVANSAYGPVREDPEVRALLVDAIGEAAAVAKAEGHDLGADYTEQMMKFVDGLPYEMVASMTVDRRRGKPMELPWFSGTIARLGEKHGIPTPVNRFIWVTLKLDAEGAAGLL
jgi:2-dehydropantoate 2-reductase